MYQINDTNEHGLNSKLLCDNHGLLGNHFIVQGVCVAILQRQDRALKLQWLMWCVCVAKQLREKLVLLVVNPFHVTSLLHHDAVNHLAIVCRD